MFAPLVMLAIGAAALLPTADPPVGDIPIVVEITPCERCVPAAPETGLAGTGLPAGLGVALGAALLAAGIATAVRARASTTPVDGATEPHVTSAAPPRRS